MKNKGNAFIISIFFVIIIIFIFAFIMATYVSEVNSLLYNIKLDLYSINKSAIIAVNKTSTSLGQFSYSKNDFELYLKKVLKSNYNLNEKLENESGLVQKVEVVDHIIYKINQKDSITKYKVVSPTIHTVIKVKIKPLLLANFLPDIFTFYIHEDVILDELKA